jgi:hypothetical protein
MLKCLCFIRGSAVFVIFVFLEILLRDRNTMIYVSFMLLLLLLMEMLVWVKTLLRGLVLL